MSVPPPGDEGTTRRTERAGHASCATAGAARTMQTAPAKRGTDTIFHSIFHGRSRVKNGSVPMSAPHPRATPVVERVLRIRPRARLLAGHEALQLRGELQLVPVGIAHHEEEIVAGPVAAGTPEHRYAALPEAVAPVAHVVPAGRLVGVVVELVPGPQKKGEAVVLVIGADEKGGERPVLVQHLVRNGEAELANVEVEKRRKRGRLENDVLQPARIRVRHGVLAG